MGVVIVGGGHAGSQAVAELRRNGYEGTIDLVCGEASLPYERPPLSKEFLAGRLSSERLLLRPASFYDQQSVNLHLGVRISKALPSRQVVECANGRRLSYDSLVLATGSSPIRLSFEGSDLEGVHYLRTIDDACAIKSDLGNAKRVLIVGGGYIGLEVAASCRSMGLEVTVLELQDRLLSRVATPFMSEFFRELHVNRGVRVLCGMGLTRLEPAKGTRSVAKAIDTNGGVHLADLVVLGIGVRPQTGLAESAGLECNNGVLVDRNCRTSADHIWAIGDCTNFPSDLYGARVRLESVPNAMEQARVLGRNLAGIDASSQATPCFWSDHFEHKLQTVGLSRFGDEEVLRGCPARGSFCLFHFSGSTLVAADAVNSRREFLAARRLVGRQVSKEALENPSIDLASLI